MKNVGKVEEGRFIAVTFRFVIPIQVRIVVTRVIFNHINFLIPHNKYKKINNNFY